MWLLFMQLHLLTAKPDSLLVMFRNAPDEKAAADIANKICIRCDSSITCYTPFINLLQEPPVTIQKVRGLYIVANTLFRFNHNAWLIRLLQSGISASKSLDPHLPILGNYYATLCNTYKFTNVLDSALFYADLAEQSYQYHQQENAYWKPDHLRYQIYLELKDFKKQMRISTKRMTWCGILPIGQTKDLFFTISSKHCITGARKWNLNFISMNFFVSKPRVQPILWMGVIWG